jgi:hypothetical protein
MELIMNKMFYLLAAGAVAVAPAMTLAGPGGHGGGHGGGATMGQGAGMGHGGTMGQGNSMGLGSAGGLSRSQATTHTSQGSTNGQGWDHHNGPSSTGQPGVECEDGVPPGKSSSARGSAFNEEGVAHEHYAGEQPQNSRNTASSSQYDTACLRPQH